MVKFIDTDNVNGSTSWAVNVVCADEFILRRAINVVCADKSYRQTPLTAQHTGDIEPNNYVP